MSWPADCPRGMTSCVLSLFELRAVREAARRRRNFGRKLVAYGPLDVTRVARLASYLRRDRIEVAHAFLFIASAYAYLATRFTPACAS